MEHYTPSERNLAQYEAKPKICTNIDIALVEVNEKGSFPVSSPQGYSATLARHYFQPTVQCEVCGQEVAKFFHPSGESFMFETFGPRWAEHVPTRDLGGSVYLQFAEKRRKRILAFKSPKESSAAKMGSILAPLFNATEKTFDSPCTIKLDTAARELEKDALWQIDKIANRKLEKSHWRLTLMKAKTSVHISREVRPPNVGDFIFLFRSRRLATWFDTTRLEVRTAGLLRSGYTAYEEAELLKPKKKQRRTKRKTKSRSTDRRRSP